MRKKKYSTGGQLLATGASFIPGAGGILSPLISAIDKSMAQNKPKDPLIPELPNTNIFGNFAFGGPILPPQESTFIQPRPLQQLGTTSQIQFSPEMMGQRINELQTGFIDSVMKNKYVDSSVGSSFKSRTPRTHFHEKALGGLITDNFIQYNTGSHNSGQDQTVDLEGTPAQGENTVQNQENSYKQYVMSDVLKNPETGNTFNVDAAKANKKHSNARFEEDRRNTLDFEMSRLQMLNDVMRAKETKQKAYGGPLGGPDEPVRNRPWVDALGKVNYPDAGYSIEAFQNNDLNVPPANNPFDIQVEYPSDRNMVGDPTQVMSAPEIQLGNPATGQGAPESRSFTGSKSRQTDNTNYGVDSRTLNGLGLLSKSLALAGSVNDAFRTAQKETPILPNYNKADSYMKLANVDYTQAKQDALGASNIAGNTNRSLSSNAAQFQGREQSRLANLQDALGRIGMQQNNAQSQLNLTKSQYELSKANRNRDIEYQNQENNLQNQANTRLADRVLFQELDNIGSSFNKASNSYKSMQNNKELQSYYVNQALALLNARTPDFELDSNIVEKLQSGKYSLDDLIKVKTQVDKVKQ